MKLIFSYLSKNQFVAALVLIVSGVILYQIRSILTVVFLAYILMAALHPAVLFLQRRKVPRIVAISLIFVVLITCIFVLVAPLMPFFVSQIQNLSTNFPVYMEEAAKVLGINIDYSQIVPQSSLGSIGNNLISLTGMVFGGIISFFTILVISFYLLVYHDRFERLIVHSFSERRRPKVRETFYEIEVKLGNWVRGQLVLSFAVGIISWIFLQLVGVSYAFPLAFIAGLLEVLPTIGPIIGSIPAIIVALTISPTLAIVVAVGFIIIQAAENNILVPKIMQTAVGLNPIVTIIAVLVGGSLMGVMGALISIPFVAMTTIILRALND